MKKFAIYILMILFCSAQLYAADEPSNKGVDQKITQSQINIPVTKAMADSAYTAEEYNKAISLYEELLQQGNAAEVYYNLGNAYYKAGNIAKALVNYERALRMAPNNNDYQANLAIVQAKIVDKYEAKPELFFITWAKGIVNLFSSNQWAILAMFMFTLTLGGLGVLIVSRNGKLRRIGLIIAFIGIILTPINMYSAYYQKSKYLNRDAAIVIEPSVIVRSTPSESGTSLFVLHEGKRVVIKDNSMSSWKEIEIENGEVGWIPLEAIEVI